MLLTLTILCFFYNGVHGTASLEIDMKLKALNKPELKTIKSEDGDIIDCVDIYKQPAFDHPALRNHKLQKKHTNTRLIPIQQLETNTTLARKTVRMFFALRSNYLGAQTNINVWNPSGVQKGDYSSAQMWLLAGDQSEMSEVIEAGWMYLVSIILTLMLYLGPCFQDSQSKNWWLASHDNVYGYWPRAIFKHLPQGATAVQWGGEVYSRNVRKKPHTKTPMGSGESPIQLLGKACYHTFIRIKDASMHPKYSMPLAEFSDENQCYTTILHKETNLSEPASSSSDLRTRPIRSSEPKPPSKVFFFFFSFCLNFPLQSRHTGAIAGAKAAAVAAVASAIPTLAAVRVFPWAKVNLNYTAQALIISSASIAAFFITADKTILQGARRNTEAQMKKVQQESK
ncbi:unnamed protein product [Brassica napus]|uniref:(rape) hypothetical protein n=1 Tax=Brassica napus TaxID=3708 RepID=A0A816KPQ6_BRANA|nr:unnamed protein product [Brassica napus]